MLKKTSFVKRKLRGLSFRIFNILENNNADFDTNGEKLFIDNLLSQFKNVGGSV